MKSVIKHLKLLMPIIILVIIFAVVGLWLRSNSFDENLLDENNIYSHIEELTGDKYEGRLTGSPGNQEAMDYITEYLASIGVRPGGENDTYYQNFSALVPQIDANPEFNVSVNGEVKEFTMYEDYKLLSSYNGGSADFSGDIILVGSNIRRIDPEFIKDKIVIIEAGTLTFDRISYVMGNGGAGIFCAYETLSAGSKYNYVSEKSLSASVKTGKSIVVGYITQETYKYLIEISDQSITETEKYCLGLVPDVNIKADITFPIQETANIVGTIDGRTKNGRTLLITANIDGAGEGLSGKYFPGALSTVSGAATLLEVARVIAEQESLPYQNVVIVFYNGQSQGLLGSYYYFNNPLYPLDETTIIHLNNLGESTREGTKVFGDIVNSSILKSNFTSYAEDAGLTVTSSGNTYSAASIFTDMKVPSVTINDALTKINNYDDTAENIDKNALKNSALVVLSYIKRVIFKDTNIDYMTLSGKLILLIFLLGLAVNYILIKLYKTNPNSKLLGSTVENIYFNSITTGIRKFYYTFTPIAFSIFFLVFLANINPEANIETVNGETVTNFSFYITVKNSIYYLKSLFAFSGNALYGSQNLYEVILNSSLRTIKLISATLSLAMVFGISRGLYEGYTAKKNNLRSLSTLVVFSIPDVLVVLMGMLLYIYISQHFPGVKEIIKLDNFVLPLITLSILPAIYISRITFITIEDEIKKEYIVNAKAKGFSRMKIFVSELFPSIIFKIIDTLPAIITMIISNMIIVEYLFNYNGVVYYLLYFFKRQDINGFIVLSLALGAIFVLFIWGIKSIARLINPLKKEEKNAKI